MATQSIATLSKRSAFADAGRRASKPGSNAEHWNQTTANRPNLTALAVRSQRSAVKGGRVLVKSSLCPLAEVYFQQLRHFEAYGLEIFPILAFSLVNGGRQMERDLFEGLR